MPISADYKLTSVFGKKRDNRHLHMMTRSLKTVELSGNPIALCSGRRTKNSQRRTGKGFMANIIPPPWFRNQESWSRSGVCCSKGIRKITGPSTASRWRGDAVIINDRGRGWPLPGQVDGNVVPKRMEAWLLRVLSVSFFNKKMR